MCLKVNNNGFVIDESLKNIPALQSIEPVVLASDASALTTGLSSTRTDKEIRLMIVSFGGTGPK